MLRNLLRAVILRVNYLRFGNAHGVSANWLSKHLDNIFTTVTEFSQTSSENLGITRHQIQNGEDIFSETVEAHSRDLFGDSYNCESGLASLLYSYILAKKPKIIVETGVANGITTNVIMRALEQTGGQLHSFDIDPRCASVYTGQGKWNFHLLASPYQRDLRSQVSQISEIDLWIHDSNHGFTWQEFEYNLAFLRLTKSGVLVSDDIDATPAFGLLTSKQFSYSAGIFDKRKFIGIAFK